jgi:Na+/melibiose symporter-like transporter
MWMKELTNKKIWLFAVGQLGWSLLSGIIVNWLVYYYQPDEVSIQAGQTLFIPQGLAVLGIATVIGAITAFGRIFDAFTDPFSASKSDACKSKDGRRIPFLKWSAIPFSLSTILIFISPLPVLSWVNAGFLFIMILIFYISITAYCTPYTALIPELGHTQKERLKISTAISFTFIVGTAIAYMAPAIWGIFEADLGRVSAMRLTFTGMALVGFLCLLVPVFTIREKDYVNTTPSNDNALKSLTETFKNQDFRIFTASDIFYWLGITMFQTGLPFFVTSLLKLDEAMTTIYFVTMTACSLLFYLPINKLTESFGKKKMMLAAFAVFSITYLYTGFLGTKMPFSPTIQGFLLCILGSFPMAVFGILPSAVVADIASSDSVLTGANREGMFYAARTFAFKLGQSISLLMFTAIAAANTVNGAGYRIVAVCSAVFCLIGGILFIFYHEKRVESIIFSGTSKERRG